MQVQLGAKEARKMSWWPQSAAERNGQFHFCCAFGPGMFRTSNGIFLCVWKNVDALVYLIRGTSNSPREHPFFVSVKLDLQMQS